MKNLSRTSSWLAAAVLAVAFTQPVSATNISDDYWGATPINTNGSVNTTWTDVIGDEEVFQIDSMDVFRSETDILTVRINTNFGDKNGTDAALTAAFGDLFLASVWNPNTDGSDGANYREDDASSGTVWTYGFAIDARGAAGVGVE